MTSNDSGSRFSSARERIDAHAVNFAEHAKTIESAKDLASLNDFIFKLCEDPESVAAFRKDPEAVLTAAGVSPELSKVVKAGQEYVLSRGGKFGGLSAAAGGDNTVTVVVVVVVVV